MPSKQETARVARRREILRTIHAPLTETVLASNWALWRSPAFEDLPEVAVAREVFNAQFPSMVPSMLDHTVKDLYSFPAPYRLFPQERRTDDISRLITLNLLLGFELAGATQDISTIQVLFQDIVDHINKIAHPSTQPGDLSQPCIVILKRGVEIRNDVDEAIQEAIRREKLVDLEEVRESRGSDPA